MTAKKSTRAKSSRAVSRAKATKKISVRTGRKAPSEKGSLNADVVNNPLRVW